LNNELLSPGSSPASVSSGLAKAIYANLFRLAAKLRLRSFYHLVVDMIERIDTAQDVSNSEAGTNPEVSSKYSPGGRWDLRMALGREISADDVFIDFGSGKGRMVYLASRYYPFRRVIGVEISRRLNDIARNNIERNRRLLRCRDIQLANADASEYQIPDDVTVVYMYDPFEGAEFDDLIRRLRLSLVRCPRDMRIIYRNPVRHDCLIDNGFTVSLKLESLAVYR
jgi:SAM-dependent methyltransferase